MPSALSGREESCQRAEDAPERDQELVSEALSGDDEDDADDRFLTAAAARELAVCGLHPGLGHPGHLWPSFSSTVMV